MKLNLHERLGHIIPKDLFVPLSELGYGLLLFVGYTMDWMMSLRLLNRTLGGKKWDN